MPLEFDDILSAVCTRVTPAHVNDFQKIYLLDDSIEAKLAFDILIAYGFDAKVYHAAGKSSKLYITNPTHSPEQLQQILSVALAYAHALKKIKASLDELCESTSDNFTIAFVNGQPTGKQVLIQIAQSQITQTHIPQAVSQPPREDMPPIAPEARGQPTAAPATISSSQPRVAKKFRKPKEEDNFASGPAVGRMIYPVKVLPEGGNKKLTLRERILLRMFGNFATSGYATLMWLVIAGVIFSFFVGSKAWLCYDFVAKKSTKWYCQDAHEVSPEEERKLKQQEEQKKLGLQPVP